MSLLDDDACTAFDELLCCWQIPLRVIASVFQQLIVGLRHLHACGVLHRDLKSDNAMVAGRDPLVLKWGDFGVSVLLSVVTEYGQGASRRYRECCYIIWSPCCFQYFYFIQFYTNYTRFNTLLKNYK